MGKPAGATRASRPAKSVKRGSRSRRGRGESMTGARDNTVEVRKIGIGDNTGLNLPAPDDYAHHMKAIKGAKDKLETAKSLVRHAKEAANKSCTGMAASIEDTIKIERENDPEKLRRRLEMLGIGLNHIGHSLQLTIFDTLGGDTLDQIYKRFWLAGKEGKTLDNRYPVGSDLHAQAARAWRHGTAANLGLTPEQSDAAVADDMTHVERNLPSPPVMEAPAAVTQH